MTDTSKIVTEVETLKESRIRHDERLKRLEHDHVETMRHLTNVESSIQEFRDEIRSGFGKISKRIDDIEGQTREQSGYKKGLEEAQSGMFKQFSLLVSVAALFVTVIVWWLSKN
jgi:predicted  nucleic acid-binding Zn-ribbon protein